MKDEIYEKYKWEDNRKKPKDVQALADNMLKYLGQRGVADMHNKEIKQAISEAREEGIEIGHKDVEKTPLKIYLREERRKTAEEIFGDLEKDLLFGTHGIDGCLSESNIDELKKKYLG